MHRILEYEQKVPARDHQWAWRLRKVSAFVAFMPGAFLALWTSCHCLLPFLPFLCRAYPTASAIVACLLSRFYDTSTYVNVNQCLGSQSLPTSITGTICQFTTWLRVVIQLFTRLEDRLTNSSWTPPLALSLVRFGAFNPLPQFLCLLLSRSRPTILHLSSNAVILLRSFFAYP